MIGLAAIAGSIATAQPPASSVSQDMVAANAAAQRCDLGAARTLERRALTAASGQWPAGHEGFFLLRQSLAQWSNQSFDYVEGEDHARAALALAQQNHGDRHLFTGLARLELAHALAGRRQFSEAERQLDDALPIFTAAGPGANLIAATLLRSNLEFSRGRPAEGLRAAENAAILAKDDPQLAAMTWLPLAEARRRMLQFAKAREALQQAQRTAGSGQRRLLLSEAALRSDEGDLGGALKIVEQGNRLPLDRCDPLTGPDADYLSGQIHLLRREISEARASFSQSITGIEQLGLHKSPRYGEALSGLAKTVGLSGDVAEANRLFEATVRAFRTSYGGTTSVEALVRLDQAYIFSATDETRQALPFAQAAVNLLDGLGDANPLYRAYAEATLGHVLKDAGQYGQAEQHLSRALAGFAAIRGEGSFDAAPGLLSLGEIKLAERDPKSAEQYLKRALAAQATGGWAGAQAVGVAHARLAAAYAAQGRRAAALDESERAIRVLLDRVALGEAMPWADAEAERRRARAIIEEEFSLLLGETASEGEDHASRSIERALTAGQLGASLRTGAAIAQMAQRLSAGNDDLALLIRRRQDLAARWKDDTERQISRLASDFDAAPAGASTLRYARDLASINHLIETQYPSAGLVLNSSVVSGEQIAGRLGADEAVLATFVGNAATLVVVIRKGGSQWFAVPVRKSDLEADVRTLRATLNSALWTSRIPPRYPGEVAHRLYETLFGPAADLLRDVAKLVVVPDGPLMSLPFALLLTQPLAEPFRGVETYRDAAWLAKGPALETVPSLAAFVLLRQIPRPRATAISFLGVGDPILPDASAVQGGLPTGDGGGKFPLSARIKALGLGELPDSGEALRTIAAEIGASRSKLLLRQDASEASLRRTDPGRYSIIAFATHGLVAGQLTGQDEPALLLSLPETPGSADDGLLEASEVGGMSLNADFVILTACNSAAGDGAPEAEPFTGLVKAFFYAGAKSVLASHWTVEAKSAAMLSTQLIESYNGGMTKAEAWRAVQLAMIGDKDKSGRTHPYFWAGFQLVGAD